MSAGKKEILDTAGINTRLGHLGLDPFACHGFVNPPIVRGSTVLFPSAGDMARPAGAPSQKYTYGTHGSPTTDALCDAINELEGTAGTVLVPSGLVAISLPLLAYLSAGDHALIVDSVYNPTRVFCDKVLKRFGISVDYYDPEIGSGIESLIKPNTKLVHLEAPGSHTLEMQDVRAISDAAHRHDCVVMMDNTWATSVFFKPVDHGVDVVIHAATKYPSGHSDVLMGFVSANEKHWPALHEANWQFGICVTSDDAYQILRGLRTMALRLERHQESALRIARWLEGRDDVAAVLHPGLPSFPGHDIWKRDFKGASGLFSFVLQENDPEQFKARAHAFLDGLKLFGLGYSWGGYECLAVQSFLGDRTIRKAPKEGPVIRLQIGLEDVEDIIADLERGFASAAEVRG